MNAIGSKRYVNVVCYDMQLDNGGEDGKPHVVLSLRVVDGPEAGRNLTKFGYLTERAAPITMENLRALGWTGTKLSRAMQDGLGTRKANCRLTVEEYEGKVREVVTGIWEPKARGPKNPVDESSLSAFDSLFEGVAAAAELPQGDPVANAAPPLPDAIDYKPAAKAEPDDFQF